MRSPRERWRLGAAAAARHGLGIGVIVLGLIGLTDAQAVTIELKDIAPDRVERQRAFAVNPAPLPGAPDTTKIEARLAEKGLKAGAPILIRIFKAESELELWMEKEGAFVPFATYPICNWSGTLGPKLREGDKQTPEGFYTVTSRQLHRIGRWRHALNLGFPNAYDESLNRDGSYILVHGGCSSVGCFAMTDPVVLEIFKLTSAALRGGQYHVPIHVFPFRMTDANVAAHGGTQWSEFWANIKEGYDSFERTQRPPRVSVCRGRYAIRDATGPQEAGSPPPLAVCGETAAAIRASNASAWIVPAPSPQPGPKEQASPLLTSRQLLSAEPDPPVPDLPLGPSLSQAGKEQPRQRASRKPETASAEAQPPPAPQRRQSRPQQAPQQPPSPPTASLQGLGREAQTRTEPTPETPAARPAPSPQTARSQATGPSWELANLIEPEREYLVIPRPSLQKARRRGPGADPTATCNLALASCRRFVALRSGNGPAMANKQASKRMRTASKAGKAR